MTFVIDVQLRCDRCGTQSPVKLTVDVRDHRCTADEFLRPISLPELPLGWKNIGGLDGSSFCTVCKSK